MPNQLESLPDRETALRYRPQLDGLRTFAVGSVLLQHFVGFENLPGILGRLPWGNMGVKLFFVLSGFLITGILLRSRDAVDASQVSRWFAARQFYIRRFLRIFPLYYFVIAVCVVINVHPVREILWWLVTYTVNIYAAMQGKWMDYYAHLWSLAVEEQFYIVWPWFVLFAPRKRLVLIMLAMVAIGIGWRGYAYARDFNFISLYHATFACLDTLGLGSLLALLHHTAISKQTIQKYMTLLVLPCGLLGAAGVFALAYREIFWPAHIVLFETFTGLFFCWLVSGATLGFRGPGGRLLESRPMVYCGKISYGIYVYQPFAASLLKRFCDKIGFNLHQPGWLNLLLVAATTVLMASISWYLLERPINNLKRHFSYRPRRPPLDAGAPAEVEAAEAITFGSSRVPSEI
jgi:peptidoglycan/LPS O-acetylase OafA/YrhL